MHVDNVNRCAVRLLFRNKGLGAGQFKEKEYLIIARQTLLAASKTSKRKAWLSYRNKSLGFKGSGFKV